MSAASSLLQSPRSGERVMTRKLVYTSAYLTLAGLALGLAGALTPILTGTASNGELSVSLSMGFLRSCASCTPSCPAFIASQCTDNFAPGGLGGPGLQAGLALSLAAWLLELLAGAVLAFLTVRDARAPPALADVGSTGNSRLLSPARLPAALVCALAVAAARAGALAAGVGYARAKVQTYFDYEAELPGGYSNATAAGPAVALLAAAMATSAAAALCYAFALHYAHPDASVPRQPFFFNFQRQPPVPKTLSRGCSENAVIWLSCIMSLTTAAVGVVWYLFCNDGTQWPLPIVVTAALLAINGKWVADAVQQVNDTLSCYLQFVAQYVLFFACMFCLVLGYVSIDQANERLEEDWVVKQNSVLLPFTTLLDQKAYNVNFGGATTTVGMLALLMSLMPLTESWAAVGGLMRLVQGRFAVIIPEFLVLAFYAAATLYFDEQAATIAVYAVPYTTAALIWQSTAAGLVLLAVLLLSATAGVWGSTIGYHFAHTLLLLPLALVTLVTAAVTLQRASLVLPFVEDNWYAGANIQRFVGPRYSASASCKYAFDSHVPMVSAGAMGMILSLLLWASAAMHWQCASALFFVGPELYALSTGAPTAAGGTPAGLSASGSRQNDLIMAAGLAAAASAAADGKRRGGSFLEGEEDPAASTAAPFLPPARGGASYGATASAGAGADESPPAKRGAGLLQPSPPARGFYNGPGGAGGAGGGDYDHVSLDDAGGGGLLALGSAAALAANTPAGLRYPITRGTSRSVVDLSAMIGRALPAGTDTSGYKAAMTAATRAYAQYLAAHGFNPLPLQSTWREAELAGAVGVPSLAALWAAWKLDIAYQWVTTRLFIVCGALVSAAAIVGMAVGLARVAALGTCAVLVAAPVSVTYSRVLSVAANYDAAQPFGFVNVVNNYPFGGIDINAPTITKGVPYGIKNHNLTVFVTFYAAAASELPSYEYFLASLNQTGAASGAVSLDDDPLYYAETSIALAPPPGVDATAKCLGAALVIQTTAFNVAYTVASKTVLVNVNGNFDDLGDNILNAKAAFASLKVTTSSAPVSLSKVLLEGNSPNKPVPSDYPNISMAPDLVVASQTGEVFMDRVTGSGISVTTSGTIHSNTVVSTRIHVCGEAVCGDVRYTATGDGRIAHTAILGGSALYMSTDRGRIVVANAAVLFASTCTMTSGTGDIVLSNFLEAYGNETYITSNGGGSINMASTFINRAIVSTVAAGKVSVTFDFMGAPTPPADTSSLVWPFPPRNYSLPLLKITTERGDIAIIGAGGSPTGDFADFASLDVRSNLGNIKAEVNGDGINANYSVSSGKGSQIVEIIGGAESRTRCKPTPTQTRSLPLQGQLGVNRGSGLNYVYMHSNTGNVQLSEMPKPY